MRPVSHRFQGIRPHRFRFPAAAACVLALLPCGPARADIAVNGTAITVTTANVIATFKGMDLVRLRNRLADEEYVTGLTPGPPVMDVETLKGAQPKLVTTGWRKGRNENAAQIVYNDLRTYVTMTVVIDEMTQDITVNQWAEANPAGIAGVRWGLKSLDLTGGKLILPALGGRMLHSKSAPDKLDFEYPGAWEAQMAVWQGREGGFVLYSRDEDIRYKRLHVSRKGVFAELAIETQAMAPWDDAASVPGVEWRINTFKGDWRVPAAGYRQLMQFYRPPLPARAGREWVNRIRTVVTLPERNPTAALLERLAKKLTPEKTLLYLPDWRRAPFGEEYPDYEPAEGLRSFVDRAHQLGFRVMVHVSATGLSPENRTVAAFQRYQVLHPRHRKKDGVRWATEGVPRRYATVNPAAPAWRSLLVARLREVVRDVGVDALHLDTDGVVWNDGNGEWGKTSYAEGLVTLHRALLSAYPSVALGTDRVTELTHPYVWFTQRSAARADMQAHPISEFLFGDHVLAHAGPDQPDPDRAPSAFAEAMSIQERQGTRPSVTLSSEGVLEEGRAGTARALALARLWQDRELGPNWTADWKRGLFHWAGPENARATVEEQAAGSRLLVDEKNHYRRITGVQQTLTPNTIPGWPAWDDASLLGLDPKAHYWLEDGPRKSEGVRLAALGPGVKLEFGQVDPAFALFRLAAATVSAEGTRTSAAIHLPAGSNPVFAGTTKPTREGPLAKWAHLPLPAALVLFSKPGTPLEAGTNLLTLPPIAADESGGVARPAPPESTRKGTVTLGGEELKGALVVRAPRGGTSVLSWVVTLPDSEKLTLSVAAGLPRGSAADAARFEAWVNGEKVWSWETDRSEGGRETVDISRWRGQTALVQLRAKTSGGISGGEVCWSEAVVR